MAVGQRSPPGRALAARDRAGAADTKLLPVAFWLEPWWECKEQIRSSVNTPGGAHDKGEGRRRTWRAGAVSRDARWQGSGGGRSRAGIWGTGCPVRGTRPQAGVRGPFQEE